MLDVRLERIADLLFDGFTIADELTGPPLSATAVEISQAFLTTAKARILGEDARIMREMGRRSREQATLEKAARKLVDPDELEANGARSAQLVEECRALVAQQEQLGVRYAHAKSLVDEVGVAT